MLTNDDLAELLESTRDRIAHMGGDTPGAQGVANVLDGLIAVLRGQAPANTVAAASQESRSSEPADPEPVADAPPEAQKRVPNRFRTAKGNTTEHKENPLLRPQYADFFNKLIASHKTEPGQEPDESEPAHDPPPAREPVRHRTVSQSTVKPQYQDFFDKLVGKQKAAPQPSAAPESESALQPQATAESHPAPEPDPASKVPESVWNGTPAPFRDETATG